MITVIATGIGLRVAWHVQGLLALHQACSNVYVVQESVAKIDMNSSDMKYNSQNEERLISLVMIRADLSGRAVYGLLLRPLACWDCGFESCRVKHFMWKVI